MSDLSDHVAAAVALLESNPYLTAVFDAPPEPGEMRQPPYVVAYVYVASEARTKVNGPTDDTHIVVVTHSVAANLEGSLIVERNVRTSLLDARPVVAGTLNTRIEHTANRPPDWDQSTGVTVMDAYDEWSYRTQPA